MFKKLQILIKVFNLTNIDLNFLNAYHYIPFLVKISCCHKKKIKDLKFFCRRYTLSVKFYKKK